MAFGHATLTGSAAPALRGSGKMRSIQVNITLGIGVAICIAIGIEFQADLEPPH
ncbi:MAG: hypothetical protein H6Q05_524 [Acidobacteria bacterium]|jgi:hypothetical protein|nr:hypothetical protein [Acidobacteriota bacterium]